jgi:hypothetical protein
MRNEKDRQVGRNNPLLRDLKIVRKPIAELRPLGRATRVHPPEQIRHLTESISANGLVLPVLIDSKNRVVDGWAVVQAATQLGFSEIPVVSNPDLSDVKLRALRIALNKAPEFSRWNQTELKLEILEIFEVEPSVPLGIDTPTLDLILDGAGADEEDDYSPTDQPAEPQCKRGDQFNCGKQVIRCDDALFSSSYNKLLGTERADMVFTDPPYNVPIAGNVTKSRDHDFAMGKGELSSPEFQDFLAISLGHAARFSRDGSIHYVCMDCRPLVPVAANTALRIFGYRARV